MFIIECLLRYSQQNFLKYGVNKYIKMRLAKILGHFSVVIICWVFYTLMETSEPGASFCYSFKVKQENEELTPQENMNIPKAELGMLLLPSRILRWASGSHWAERCPCYTCWAERWINFPSITASNFCRKDFCTSLPGILGFRIVWQAFHIKWSSFSCLLLPGTLDKSRLYTHKRRGFKPGIQTCAINHQQANIWVKRWSAIIYFPNMISG